MRHCCHYYHKKGRNKKEFCSILPRNRAENKKVDRTGTGKASEEASGELVQRKAWVPASEKNTQSVGKA